MVHLPTTVIAVHGCPSDRERSLDPVSRTYDKHWMPWLKKELDAKGISNHFPLMPKPWSPHYESYKKAFEKVPIDESSVLIGHSCGCAFLVRWLGESKQRVKGLILVAPWKIPDGIDIARKEFYGYPIDESIRDRVGKIILFTSDNEQEDGKKSVVLFHDALGGTIIDLPHHGHYTLRGMGTPEFPELLAEIVKLG